MLRIELDGDMTTEIGSDQSGRFILLSTARFENLNVYIRDEFSKIVCTSGDSIVVPKCKFTSTINTWFSGWSADANTTSYSAGE